MDQLYDELTVYDYALSLVLCLLRTLLSLWDYLFNQYGIKFAIFFCSSLCT